MNPRKYGEAHGIVWASQNALYRSKRTLLVSSYDDEEGFANISIHNGDIMILSSKDYNAAEEAAGFLSGVTQYDGESPSITKEV